MSPVPEKPPSVAIAPRAPAVERAVLSLLLPGLGQFAQRRFLTGAGQLGTVLAIRNDRLALGGSRALLLAIAWNLWSAVDAYRYERP